MNDLGRIVWDVLWLVATLGIGFFVIRWTEGKLDENGASYKALKYLFH
jgi:hypothetical protein